MRTVSDSEFQTDCAENRKERSQKGKKTRDGTVGKITELTGTAFHAVVKLVL